MDGNLRGHSERVFCKELRKQRSQGEGKQRFEGRTKWKRMLYVAPTPSRKFQQARSPITDTVPAGQITVGGTYV